MKYGLTEETIEKIIDIVKAHDEVDTLILYGSRATGHYRKASDIDLVIKGKNLTLSILFTIETILDDLLLPYFIDLHIYHFIQSEALLEQINEHGVVLYERANDITSQLLAHS